VLDARAVEGAIGDEPLPGCRARGALTDDDVDRFNDGYARTWGDRGTDREHDWRLRHGDDELRFGARPPAAGGLGAGGLAAGGLAGAAASAASGGRADEPWDGSRTVADRDRLDRDRLDRDRLDEPRRLMDTSGPTELPSPQPPLAHGAHFDESRRIDQTLGGLDAERRAAAMDDARDRRGDRVDDASGLADDRGLEPRELDARVRLDEGATVDDRTPVGGVRYEGAHEPHDYGRPDERYGDAYGSGRIGFDRVVTRRPWRDDDLRAGTPATPAPSATSPTVDALGDRSLGDRSLGAHEGMREGSVRDAGVRDAGVRESVRDTAHDAREATRDVTRGPVPSDTRDHDRDGHVSLGERLREGLDRLRGVDRPDAGQGAGDARRVRYRQYDDRYDPGGPGR
jgi:hypothetical protein